MTLLTATLGWSQYEIISIERVNDDFCAWDYKSYTIKVIHPGNSAPSLVTTATSTNQGLLDITYNNSLLYTDTIEFNVDVYDGQNWVAAGVTEDDSLEFSFLTDVGAPIPSLDTLIEVTVSGDVNVSFDFTGADLCTNGQPFDLNDYVSLSGGNYNIGSEIVSSIFNPKNYYEATMSTSVTINYEVYNTAGCSGSIEEYLTLNMVPTANVVTNPSNCGSANGDATVNITPGTASGALEVYWSTGFLDPAVL